MRGLLFFSPSFDVPASSLARRKPLERSVEVAPPRCCGRSPLRDNGGWKGVISGVVLHPGLCPPARFPKTSPRGDQAAEPPGGSPPRPSGHRCGPVSPPWDLKPGRRSQGGGSVQNTGAPAEGAAERGGRLGRGSRGRRAPLPPLSSFVPGIV